MTDATFPPFHEKMQCFVQGVTYDYQNRVGQVFMSECGCTDMDGCIAFYKGIDPAVTTIRTFAGAKPDTVYFIRDGDWHSVDGAA